jgi:hypothetical protein
MKKVILPLTWAWIIIVGALMLTPGNITCIKCGPVLTKVLGVFSIVIGVVGLVHRRELAALR